MKIIDTEENKTFKSFSMKISFDSKEDCIKLFNMMNSSDVIESFNFKKEARLIRDFIEEKYPEIIPEYSESFDKGLNELRAKIEARL